MSCLLAAPLDPASCTGHELPPLRAISKRRPRENARSWAIPLSQVSSILLEPPSSRGFWPGVWDVCSSSSRCSSCVRDVWRGQPCRHRQGGSQQSSSTMGPNKCLRPCEAIGSGARLGNVYSGSFRMSYTPSQDGHICYRGEVRLSRARMILVHRACGSSPSRRHPRSEHHHHAE